ncbi:uncharacterized protein LOC116172306 [Photinus pyralis]|uniref:uncharacterized protein LOC116172306 n=1 Tax=Photinus pyralis TaxID=7054 RepID=UPI001267097F|nr:uncharacterized protein LOC116172306 [Photinus pyralis]
MEANASLDEISIHLLQLRKVLEGHDILRKFEFDENYLVRFLLGTNFHVPDALKRILEFHLLFLSDYTWFTTDGPADIIEILNMNTMIGLPLRDKDGRSVILVKLGNLDVSVGTMVMHVHLFHMWAEHFIQDELSLLKGVCILIDVNSFSWGMFKWLTPHTIKTAIRMVENYPVKEMTFHVVNKSYLLQAAVKLVWPLLSREMQCSVTRQARPVLDRSVTAPNTIEYFWLECGKTDLRE